MLSRKGDWEGSTEPVLYGVENVLDLVPPEVFQVLDWGSVWADYKLFFGSSSDQFKVVSVTPHDVKNANERVEVLVWPEWLTTSAADAYGQYIQTFEAGYAIEDRLFSRRFGLACLPSICGDLKGPGKASTSPIRRKSSIFKRTARATPLNLWLRLLVPAALPRGALRVREVL